MADRGPFVEAIANLRRLAERIQPGSITTENVTVSDRMESILKRLETEPTFVFTSLLPERPTVGYLVATFLACLELARLGKLKLEQDASFAEINCSKAEANAGPNAGEAADGNGTTDTLIGIENLSFLHPAMFLVGLVIAVAAVPWGWPTFQAWRAGSDAARRDQLPS
mgnify:CR=1 FL=1